VWVYPQHESNKHDWCEPLKRLIAEGKKDHGSRPHLSRCRFYDLKHDYPFYLYATEGLYEEAMQQLAATLAEVLGCDVKPSGSHTDAHFFVWDCSRSSFHVKRIKFYNKAV